MTEDYKQIKKGLLVKYDEPAKTLCVLEVFNAVFCICLLPSPLVVGPHQFESALRNEIGNFQVLKKNSQLALVAHQFDIQPLK